MKHWGTSNDHVRPSLAGLALLAAVIAAGSQRIVTDAWAEEHIGTNLRGSLVDFGEGLIRFIGMPEPRSVSAGLAHAASHVIPPRL